MSKGSRINVNFADFWSGRGYTAHFWHLSNAAYGYLVQLAILRRSSRPADHKRVTGDELRIMMRRYLHLEKLSAVLAALAIFCAQAGAQSSTSSGGNVNTSWGYYSWQVDHGTVTTTLTTETGFTVAPPGGGFQVPVSLPTATTIHEVHGNVAFTVWSQGSCTVGSIIAQVRNQSGNVIASVNMENIAAKTSDDIPIKGTFPAGLSITSLQLTTFSSQCSPLTISWSLAMS